MKRSLLIITILSITALGNVYGNEIQKIRFGDQIASDTISKDSVQRVLAKAQAGNPDAQNLAGIWYYSGTHVSQNYTSAYDLWKSAALQDHTVAIGNLGLCYQYGHGVAKDTSDALRLYMRSIKKGNAKLLEERQKGSDKHAFDGILVGLCYQRGNGVAKDLKKAVEYFEKAAKLQSSDAQRELALLYLNAKEDDKAAPWFKKAAAAGDLSSTYYYGKLLLEGRGLKKDEQEAVIYLLKAAEADFAKAQAAMGDLYASGTGVPSNEETSAQWYQRASGNGDIHAMWCLAIDFMKGTGVSRNYDAALFWFAEAYTAGYQRSFKKLLSEDETVKGSAFPAYVAGMKAYLVESDYVQAMEEFKKVEKQKVTDGKIMQAVLLANKDYPKNNPKKGFKMLKSAAVGHPQAAFLLATLYEYGRGTDKNMDEALSLYTKSADAGYGTAQSYLGDIYYEGRGTAQDYDKAVEYYQKARSQRQLTQNATKRLASCYENGWGGLSSDNKMSLRLLKEERKNNVLSLLKEYQATKYRV